MEAITVNDLSKSFKGKFAVRGSVILITIVWTLVSSLVGDYLMNKRDVL